MTRVVSLFRYPVKGFTPEARQELRVRRDGRVEGDRVLAIRFADAVVPESRDGLDYWPKSKGLSLQDFPSLAQLALAYDDERRVVTLTHDGRDLVTASLEEAGRRRLVEVVTAFVLASPEARRLERPGRMPLSVVGDGATSRFQDRPRGFVSLHGRASARAVAEAVRCDIDDRRFRSNIVVDGLDAWQELRWAESIRIGDVVLRPEGPIVRCLATHANPDTGVRDAPILTTLTHALGQDRPTLGRLLLPEGAGGVIRVGDEVAPL